MNPLDMMKFSSLWSTFTANHPKFPKFIAAASRKGLPEKSPWMMLTSQHTNC